MKAPAIIEDSDDTPLPSSWLRVSFDDVFLNQTSSDRKIPLSEYLSEGAFPIVDQGQAAIGGYTNRAELVSLSPLPAIIFGDHTRAIKWCDRPFVQGADGVRVLTTSAMALPRFGYWALKNVALPDRGYSRHYKYLRASVVPIPPVPEQARIVEKIDALRARSERARRALFEVPTLLGRLRQSILAAAFRGDLTADWRARNPDVESAEELLEKIQTERRRRWEEAELARLTAARSRAPADAGWKLRYKEGELGDASQRSSLPSSWVWAPLDQLRDYASSIVYGIIQPGEDVPGGVPYIRPLDISPSGMVDLSNLKRTAVSIAQDYVRSSLLPGDVILSIVGTIGKTMIVLPDLTGANVTQSSVRIRVGPWMTPEFLRSALMSPSLTAQYDKFRFGNAVQRLNVEHVRNLMVPFPPVEEQREIVARLAKMFNLQLSNIHVSLIRDLEDLDQAILAKAFRGELVHQDPSDEPASELLDRLRVDAGASPAKAGRRTRTPTRSESPTTPKSENAMALPSLAPIANAERAGAFVETVPGRTSLTTSPPVQQTLRLATPVSDFLDLTAEAQTICVHRILLGEGPLEREDAVRRAAELLRDAGQASFQRLRRDGTLATCIDAALAVGLRQGHFDRPRPGTVRAIAREPGDVPPALWRRALLAALAEPAADDDAAVRAAAAWSQAQFGLDFQRLRTGGHIDTALRAALTDLLGTGEVTRDRQGTLRARIG